MKNNMKKLITALFAVFVLFGLFNMGFVSKIKADEEIIEWNYDYLPDEPGSYKLMSDVETNQNWSVSETITIYLNGKNIVSKSNDVMYVSNGATLNIYGEGTIGHDGQSSSDGIVVDGGTLNLFGGTILNNQKGINAKSGTVVLGNSETYPEIVNNTYGIFTPNNSTADITINDVRISDNNRPLYLQGSNNVVMNNGIITAVLNEGVLSDVVYINNSNVTFTINKGSLNGTNSFTKDTLADVHPTINIGSTADPTNEIYIIGAINTGKDNLTIYDGYYNEAAYDSVKDNNFFYPGRMFVDSDKQEYVKKVVKDDTQHHIYFRKDEQYDKSYYLERNPEWASVNEKIEIVVHIRKEAYALRELTVQSRSGKIIETTSNDGVHYYFDMPDESVTVIADVRICKRIRFDLVHATSDFDKVVVFPGDVESFTLTPESEAYEKCYVFSDDVQLVQDSENENKYTLTVPDKDVLVKGAYLLHNHEHDGKTFYVWDQSDKVPAIDGSFALGNDLTLNKTWIQTSDFDLCLNGHTISAKNAIQHDRQNTVLNIYDCKDSGKIANAGVDLAISATQGTVNMYGGTITGFESCFSTGNGKISIYKGTVSATDKVFRLGHFSSLTIGSETDTDTSAVFINGRFEYSDDVNIKLYSGFYDGRAHRNLGFYGENKYVVGEGRGFKASGRSDNYTYTIGDITKFRINVLDTQNGSVTASADSALRNTEITLTIVPDTNYELGTLTVKDAKGNEIVVNENKFVMPASDVTVEATFKKKEFEITFYNGESLLQALSVPYNELPAYTGDTPTKGSDAQYTYTFNGWTPTIVPAKEDTSYNAEFSAEPRKYTVTFYDEDEETVLQTSEVEYGQYPAYTGTTPTKEGMVFVGWNPEISKVEANQTYTAKFSDKEPTKYTITFVYNGQVVEYGSGIYDSGVLILVPTVENKEIPEAVANEQYIKTFTGWLPEIIPGETFATTDITYVAQFDVKPQQYTITWKNGNQVLDQQKLEYGTKIEYSGPTPTKEPTVQYAYVFNGVWSSENSQRYDVVRRDDTLTAIFDEVLREYTITWLDEDGTVLEVDENVQYDKMPSYNGPIPSKEPTGEYSYEFSWDPEISRVKGNATYTAKFTPVENIYKVTFINDDGTILQKSDYKYNEMPVYEGTDPTKAKEGHKYVFDGWDPEIDKVKEDTLYTAKYYEIFKVTIDRNDGSDLVVISVNEGDTLENDLKPEPSKDRFNFGGWFTDDDTKWEVDRPVDGNMRLTAQFYPESTPSKINGKDVMVASDDLQGQTINNHYNDKPLVIKTDNGIIVVPANLKEDVTIPEISNKENIVSCSYDDIIKNLDMDITDHMFGIYLDVQKSDIDDLISKEDKKQGYIEVENSGFEAEFREIINNEGDTVEYDYPGSIILTIHLDKMGISLPRPSEDKTRSFYAGHRYSEDMVEYLPMSISSDRSKGYISVSTLSPFAIVYKDSDKTKPSTPTYLLPKTGIE